MANTTHDDLNALSAALGQALLPTLRAAKYTIIVVAPGDPDGYVLLQAGIAVLYDRPIIAIALKGAVLSDTLSSIARVVVTGIDMNTESGRQEFLRWVIAKEAKEEPRP